MKKTIALISALSLLAVSSCGSTASQGETSATGTGLEVIIQTSDDTETSEEEAPEETEAPEEDELTLESIIGKSLGELENEYDLEFEYLGQYSVSHIYEEAYNNFDFLPLVSFKLDDYSISTVFGASLGYHGSFRGIEAGMSYNELSEVVAHVEIAKPDNVMNGIYTSVFELDEYKVIVEWGENYENDDQPSGFILVCLSNYSPTAEELAAASNIEIEFEPAPLESLTVDDLVGKRLNDIASAYDTEFGYYGQFSFIYDYNDFTGSFPYLPVTAFDFFEDENPEIIGAAINKGGNFMGAEPGMSYNEIIEHISAEALGRPSFDDEAGGFNITAEVGEYMLYIDWGETYFDDDQPCIYMAVYQKDYPIAEEDGAIYESIE